MTEKQKAHAGLLFDPDHDPEMMAENASSLELCSRLNSLAPSKTDRRREILCELLGSFGEGSKIESPFHCDFGTNIFVGRDVRIGPLCSILDGTFVRIGDGVRIGARCGIHPIGHPLDVKTRLELYEFARAISIGKGTWVGQGVTILPGVSIGEGCIIESGSVVTRDIPPNSIAGGDPCRVKGPAKAPEKDGGGECFLDGRTI